MVFLRDIHEEILSIEGAGKEQSKLLHKFKNVKNRKLLDGEKHFRKKMSDFYFTEAKKF